MQTEYTINHSLVLEKYEMGGKNAEDIKEERETYLKRNKIIRKIIKQIRAGIGEIFKKTPKEVAIPFPPLKPKKGVKQCPSTAITPASPTQYGKMVIIIIIHTARYPLKPSKRKVIKPPRKPNFLETLVAPIFPLPVFLISSFENR